MMRLLRRIVLAHIIKAKHRKGKFEPMESYELAENAVVDIVLPERTKGDREAFLRSAGSWSDIDADEFITHIHERRATRRSPVNF
jgi:hypothetical protein